MQGSIFKSENGSTLTTVVSVVLILATLGFILASITSSSTTTQMLEAEEQKAFYAAQSGMEYGLKEYLAVDDVKDWAVSDMDVGNGTTADISLTKVGNDQILIKSTGRSNTNTSTVETVVLGADSNYVPDYAVWSKRPVSNIMTKDSLTGDQDAGLVMQNAPSTPVFDLDKLRTLAQKEQEDGNTYYFEDDFIVNEDFNPPSGTVVFTEGKLKFNKGNWDGDVYFVAMDDISFISNWRNSEDVRMTVYQPNEESKVWIEPRNFEDDPIEWIIEGGQVIAQEPFAANVKILGCAIESYPVTMNIVVDNSEEMFPFGVNPDDSKITKSLIGLANLNDGKNPRSYTLPNTYPENTPIYVEAKSWTPFFFFWYQKWHDRSSTDDPTLVWTLRDGDTVPSVEGWGNQADAADYLENYIDFDKQEIVLDDNQAIFLFELATSDPNGEYADFQDLVVLLTLAKDGDLIEDSVVEADAEDVLSFTGGIISHSEVYGTSIDTYEDEEIVTTLQVVRDEQIIKDFLKLSVNGNSRVLFATKWNRKN